MERVELGAALLGGVCLVVNLFLDAAIVSWSGLAVLAVAVAVVGARLAREPWLAVVCALGSVGLAASVLVVLRDSFADRQLDAAVGGLASLCVALAVLRRSPTAEPGSTTAPAPSAAPTGRRGNHRS